MQTLQDVLDAVGAFPERYGRRAWFTAEGEPVCPLAKEVLVHDSDGVDPAVKSAKLLHCSVTEIIDFTSWWDGVNRADNRARLERRCYRVPEIG